jgi:hypothetical protein
MQEKFDFEAIDFNELYMLLLAASRHAFRSAQESHPDETFYAFGLYYSKAAKFVYATCSSEEAHLRKRNLTEDERERQTLAWFYQRWNPRKWPYFMIEHDHFNSASGWISRVWRSARLFPDTLVIWDNINYQLERICMKVLKTLDEEGMFGEGAARENVLLTYRVEEDVLLWERDEYERVCLLNPASTYLRWRIEKELSDHAQSFLERDQEDEWEER